MPSRVSSTVFAKPVRARSPELPRRSRPRDRRARGGAVGRESFPSASPRPPRTEHVPRLRARAARRSRLDATRSSAINVRPFDLIHHRRRADARPPRVRPRASLPRAAAVAVRAAEDKESDVHRQGPLGEGRPEEVRGARRLVHGGWPGGEVGLKESFIQEPFETPAQSSVLNPLPDDVAGDDTVYLGKGKFVKADATKFAARDNLLTGGWAGGEVALKTGDALRLKPGDYVAIKNQGFFSFFQGGARKTGTVKKVEWSKAGSATVTVSVLPFDNVEAFPGDAPLEKIVPRGRGRLKILRASAARRSSSAPSADADVKASARVSKQSRGVFFNERCDVMMRTMRTKYTYQKRASDPSAQARGLFARVVSHSTRARASVARIFFSLFRSLSLSAAHALTAPATPVPENALSLLITETTEPNIAIARTTCASPESRPASPPRFSSRAAHRRLPRGEHREQLLGASSIAPARFAPSAWRRSAPPPGAPPRTRARWPATTRACTRPGGRAP